MLGHGDPDSLNDEIVQGFYVNIVRYDVVDGQHVA